MKKAMPIFAYLALLVLIVFIMTIGYALYWMSQHHPDQLNALGQFLFNSVYVFVVLIEVASVLMVIGLLVHVYNKATVIHKGDVVVIRTMRGFYHASEMQMRAAHVPELYKRNIKQVEDEVVESDQPKQLEAPRILSFAELLRTGVIQDTVGKGQLILGYVNGMLKIGSWLDLYSCAVAGTSGSGKTTTVLFLLFQAILCGAKIILIDPHLNNPDESLAARLMPLKKAFHAPPVDDSDIHAILTRVQWFKNELARRKQIGKKGKLVVFCIDEFNAVMRIPEVKKELAELLVAIEQEGRKFGIFALLIGQVWTAQQIGGADLRRSLASRIVHRIDEEYAKLLLGSKYGRECIELEVGNSWFRDTNGGTHKMITPATYREDGYAVASILGWDEYIPSSQETEESSSMYVDGRYREEAQEAVVRHQEEKDTEPNLSEIKLLRDIGKRIKKGEDRADILRSYGATSGRLNQEIGAAIDMVRMEMGEM